MDTNHSVSLRIDMNSQGMRIDKIARKWYAIHNDTMSLSAIFRLFRVGSIRCNGKKVAQNYLVRFGDELFFPLGEINIRQKIATPRQQKYLFDIKKVAQWVVYQNADRCIRNKPAGISVQSAPDQPHNMQEILRTYTKREGLYDSIFPPAFCHRLDRDTSGILISGLNHRAVSFLNTAMHERDVQKYYLTIVAGAATPIGKRHTIDAPLQKTFDKSFGRGKISIDKNGKMSITHIQNICTWSMDDIGPVSLLFVRLGTGRMHQIRVHCAYSGFPLLGDVVYGIPSVNRKFFRTSGLSHHVLHCWKYGFVGLSGAYQSFTAPWGEYLEKIISQQNVKQQLSVLSQKLDNKVGNDYP